MRWFNNNKVTEGLKLQVNQLGDQLSSVRDNFRNVLFGISHDGKRDVNDIYGYPQVLSGEEGFRLMYAMASREGIANRVTFGTAKTCWRDGFEVFEGDDDDDEEVLEEEIKRLNKKGMLNFLERVDILNRIGGFSCLYIGVPDGRDPREPLGKVTGDGFKSIYFRAFAYDGIYINKTDQDVMSPRFGMPELYQVQRMARGDTEKDVSLTSMVVHWTRIIHLAEGMLDSDIEGIPYLKPIYNRILDLNKAVGGSAEAYFRNAKGKIAFEVHQDFAASSLADDNRNKMNDAAKKFTNEYQDHIYAAGAKVSAVNTPHASPLDTVKTILWEIAGYSGYPVRILTGEGSGQLAGSEDQLALNAIISDRQHTVCAGWVVRLFEILSQAGMLEWNDSWVIRFPKQTTVTEMQQVDLDKTKAETLKLLAEAKSAIGGDEIDFRSALDEMGLSEVMTDSLPSGTGLDVNYDMLINEDEKPIKIKKSKEGSLRRIAKKEGAIKEDGTISREWMRKKMADPNTSAAVKKKINFALNI